MKVTWFGTACIKLEAEGQTILFDPFLRRYGNTEEKLKNILALEKTILITHGHFDHIADMKKIYDNRNDITVYGSHTPVKSLKRDGIPENRLRQIKPGDVIPIGGFKVYVRQGRHIIYDAALKRNAFLNKRNWLHIPELWWMLCNCKKYPENGEILFYEIEAEGKVIQVMGSAGLDTKETYRQHADLLIMAFQGRTDITTYALTLMERLKPKKVMLSHFDDAFPPISSDIDTKPFYQLMKKKYPEVEVMIPQLDVSYKL